MALNPVWFPRGPEWIDLFEDLGHHYFGLPYNQRDRRGDYHPPIGMDPVHGGPVHPPRPPMPGIGRPTQSAPGGTERRPQDHPWDITWGIGKAVRSAVGGSAGSRADVTDMVKGEINQMPFNRGITRSYGGGRRRRSYKRYGGYRRRYGRRTRYRRRRTYKRRRYY